MVSFFVDSVGKNLICIGNRSTHSCIVFKYFSCLYLFYTSMFIWEKLNLNICFDL